MNLQNLCSTKILISRIIFDDESLHFHSDLFVFSCHCLESNQTFGRFSNALAVFEIKLYDNGW